MKAAHEVLWPVLCKKLGFRKKPHFFFYFIVAQFHVKLTKKCWDFSDFLASKNETGWWFHTWNWHEIMKPPNSVRKKKLKLTARGFAAAVSFNFFSWPNLDGFIISVSFMYETTASFIFWAKKQKKSQHFSSVSRETGHKKKVRFIPKTSQAHRWVQGPEPRPERKLAGFLSGYNFFF